MSQGVFEGQEGLERMHKVLGRVLFVMRECRTIGAESILYRKNRPIYMDGPGKKPDEPEQAPVPNYSEMTAREQRIYELGQQNGIGLMALHVYGELKSEHEDAEGESLYGLDGMTPLTQ